MEACKPWLAEELRAVESEALVFPGATAAKAPLGSAFRVTQHRGELLDSDLAPKVAATIHPSSILRQRDDESRYAERAAFAEDLRVVAQALGWREPPESQ